MPTILITGGTGLIGKALTLLLLEKGYEVIVMTREKPGVNKARVAGVSYASWDVAKQAIDADAIKKADCIVHLAGAGVADKRWSGKRKKEIIESRTRSSSLLVSALTENDNKVKVVVSASAIGWYGPDPVVPNPDPFIESGVANTDFLGNTCKQWEQSVMPVAQMGKRLAIIRTGIVLSSNGGALAEFIKPVGFGIAAILGTGKQIVSWIHVDDLCRIYLQAIEDANMQGVFNAVAPHPVSNKTLTIALAKAIKGRFYIAVHVPSAILKLILGEMSVEVLKSATVAAGKIKATGFSFIYPSIESAISQLTGKR